MWKGFSHTCLIGVLLALFLPSGPVLGGVSEPPFRIFLQGPDGAPLTALKARVLVWETGKRIREDLQAQTDLQGALVSSFLGGPACPKESPPTWVIALVRDGKGSGWKGMVRLEETALARRRIVLKLSRAVRLCRGMVLDSDSRKPLPGALVWISPGREGLGAPVAGGLWLAPGDSCWGLADGLGRFEIWSRKPRPVSFLGAWKKGYAKRFFPLEKPGPQHIFLVDEKRTLRILVHESYFRQGGLPGFRAVRDQLAARLDLFCADRGTWRKLLHFDRAEALEGGWMRLAVFRGVPKGLGVIRFRFLGDPGWSKWMAILDTRRPSPSKVWTARCNALRGMLGTAKICRVEFFSSEGLPVRVYGTAFYPGTGETLSFSGDHVLLLGEHYGKKVILRTWGVTREIVLDKPKLSFSLTR